MNTRRLNASLVAVVAALSLSGCVTSIQTHTDYDASASFSDYQTYAWISEKPMITAPRMAVAASPFLEGRIQQAIRSELEAQGYRFATDPADADFVVSFSVGARRDISVESYPVAYRSGWRWGTTYIGDSVKVDDSTEGMLSIDFFDQQTKSPIWHGVARKNLTTADEKLQSSIVRDAVGEILKSFPPTS